MEMSGNSNFARNHRHIIIIPNKRLGYGDGSSGSDYDHEFNGHGSY